MVDDLLDGAIVMLVTIVTVVTVGDLLDGAVVMLVTIVTVVTVGDLLDGAVRADDHARPQQAARRDGRRLVYHHVAFHSVSRLGRRGTPVM